MHEAYIAGYNVFTPGTNVQNPYWLKGGEQFSQWSAGWNKAAREALARPSDRQSGRRFCAGNGKDKG